MKGRGRLSKIDLLPQAAAETVAWAEGELLRRNRTTGVIWLEFNQRLALLDLAPIGKSAFYRFSKETTGNHRPKPGVVAAAQGAIPTISCDEEVLNDFAADVLERLNGLPISEVERVLNHAKWLAKATHRLSSADVIQAVETAAAGLAAKEHRI